MSVSELIAKLDAAKLQAEEDARRAAAEQAARLESIRAQTIAAEQERLAEERARQQAAAEAEKAKWAVDEEASAAEVAAAKAKLLAQLQPKKTKPKVVIKDIATIVIDLGSGLVKAGYAGQDAPTVILNSIVGTIANPEAMDLDKHAHIDKDVYIGDQAFAYHDVLKIDRLFQRGVIRDADSFERLMSHVLFDELKLTPEAVAEHPILLTEPPRSPIATRELYADVLFNKLNSPALFVANTSSLALFGTGAVTGVVVQIGYHVATSVAVFEGQVIPNTLMRLDVAGKELDAVLQRMLRDKSIDLDAKRMFDSFLLRDIKERHCYVAYDYDIELARANGQSKVSSQALQGNVAPVEYEVKANGNEYLPGYESRTVPDVITLGDERFRCCEALFNPRDVLGRDETISGIHKMVEATIQNLPIDLKRTMFGNIVLAGGTSLLPGLADRLSKELRTIAPPSVTINIVDATNRHLTTWTGGSVLASMKSFNHHWISKDEYMTYGVDLLHATRET